MNYPLTRLRRLRANSWIRDLVREHSLKPSDLIYPMFVVEGKKVKQEIKTLPGVHRLSIDLIVEQAKRAKDLGIPVVALFPAVEKKTEDAREAFSRKNLICRTVEAIKKHVPGIGVMCDVALDPYTTHGHDGIVKDGDVANDLTIEALIKQAKVMVESGCDILAPSDMMDGRVLKLREFLESKGHHNIIIMSYGVKFVSSFYGPFRDAVGSSKQGGLSKLTYQVEAANAQQALNELVMDEQEGADMLIIKPGMPYLDIIAQARGVVNVPLIAYQVSGEYAMLKFAAAAGAINYEQALLESLIAFKRAGCSGVITYAALDLAYLYDLRVYL
ncbi:MAG: porphobilinogen synthase [Rickettsiales bacterium]